jgi:hypothetical protein
MFIEMKSGVVDDIYAHTPIFLKKWQTEWTTSPKAAATKQYFP